MPLKDDPRRDNDLLYCDRCAVTTRHAWNGLQAVCRSCGLAARRIDTMSAEERAVEDREMRKRRELRNLPEDGEAGDDGYSRDFEMRFEHK